VGECVIGPTRFGQPGFALRSMIHEIGEHRGRAARVVDGQGEDVAAAVGQRADAPVRQEPARDRRGDRARDRQAERGRRLVGVLEHVRDEPGAVRSTGDRDIGRLREVVAEERVRHGVVVDDRLEGDRRDLSARQALRPERDGLRPGGGGRPVEEPTGAIDRKLRWRRDDPEEDDAAERSRHELGAVVDREPDVHAQLRNRLERERRALRGGRRDVEDRQKGGGDHHAADRSGDGGRVRMGGLVAAAFICSPPGD